MAKKQTYAALMKQLSNKKSSYEAGLDEARRMGSQSGIRDYERRLTKLSAGMDELFGAQEQAKQMQAQPTAQFGYGGKTMKYADGGFTAAQYRQVLDHMAYNKSQGYGDNSITDPHLKPIFEAAEAARAAGIDPMQGWDGIATGDIGKYEQGVVDNENLIVEDGGFTAADYKQYQNHLKNHLKGRGTSDPKLRAKYADIAKKSAAAAEMGLDPSKGFDGIPVQVPQTDTERLAGQRQATADAAIAREPGGKSPYNTSQFGSKPYDGTPGVYHHNGQMFTQLIQGTPVALTEPMLRDAGKMSKSKFIEGLSSGVYGPQTIGETGTRTMTGGVGAVEPTDGSGVRTVDPSGNQTYNVPAEVSGYDATMDRLGFVDPNAPTQGPSTASAPRMSAADARASVMAQFGDRLPGGGAGAYKNDPLYTGESNAQINDRSETFTAAQTLERQRARAAAEEQAQLDAMGTNAPGYNLDFDATNTGRSRNAGLDQSQGGGANGFQKNMRGQMIGSAIGGAAQLMNTRASMNAVRNQEGPVDNPFQRMQMMNTDIQTGAAVQQIKDAEARSAAALGGNVSNPAVRAAMLRAQQRASQEKIGQITANEATQEAQMRNQNLMNINDTLNQNRMIGAQNRQRSRDFENDRSAALNRLRNDGAQQLGGVANDFMRMQADTQRLKYMREAYDPYGLGASDDERTQ